MPYAELADGMTLYYELWGKGPPVVFVHALSMNRRFWDSQVVTLSDKYSTVVYDQRGHGRSEISDCGYGFETYAEDLGELLHKLDLRNITLVGWSIGSWAALEYAYRSRCSRISRLVLLGASPRLLADRDWPHCPPAGSFERFLNDLILDRAKATHDFYKALLNDAASSDLLDWIVRTSLEMPLKAFVESAKRVVHADKRGILPEITVPTLVVNGRHDPACPLGAGQYMVSNMPHARLVTLDRSGHFPQVEQPQEFNVELLRFIAENQA